MTGRGPKVRYSPFGLEIKTRSKSERSERQRKQADVIGAAMVESRTRLDLHSKSIVNQGSKSWKIQPKIGRARDHARQPKRARRPLFTKLVTIIHNNQQQKHARATFISQIKGRPAHRSADYDLDFNKLLIPS